RQEMLEPTSVRANLEVEFNTAIEKIAAASDSVNWAVSERHDSLLDIARGLKPGSALVDFVNYRRFELTEKSSGWREEHYVAYVTLPITNTSSNVATSRVDLGEAQPIDEAAGTILRRMSAGQYRATDVQSAIETLSQLVYAPLAKHVENVSHLLICPDGQLS